MKKKKRKQAESRIVGKKIPVKNESKTYTGFLGHEFTEHKLDHAIALRIKQLALGLKGERKHTYRALSIQVIGIEDQMMGCKLMQLAAWTLGEDWGI